MKGRTMRKIQILFAALVAVMMSACVQFKTEATVDVEVFQNGKAVGSGIVVYKFIDKGLGQGTSHYKENATGSAKTNAAGIAHFDLKSPDDFSPSSIAGKEEVVFYFSTFDNDDRCIASVQANVKTGDKKTVRLEIVEN